MLESMEMLDIAYRYATNHRISFSTNVIPSKSKTKGIIFSDKSLRFSHVPIKLDCIPLPWVEQSKYLGNRMTSRMDGFSSDIREKRAQFITRNCELNQEFSLAHPAVKCKINAIYNSSFPGSVLWDLSCDNAKMIVNSWSVAVRHMWDLPFNSHRYLIEELSGMHAQTMLICRFINFIQSIKKSPKQAVQFLYQKVKSNVETVTGKNIRYVIEKSGVEDIEDMKTNGLKKSLKFCESPSEHGWKVQFIKEIVDVKQKVLFLNQESDMMFEDEDLEYLIEFLSTN